MSDPYERLCEIQQISVAKAEKLSDLNKQRDDWVGIGFRLGQEELVSPMGDVKEILDPPEYTRVPGVKPWVVGIANVRGSLLPLVDLKGFVTGESIKNRKKGRVLVVSYRGMNTGLLVDEVIGMRHFSPTEQTPDLPQMSEVLVPYVSQAFLRNDAHWLVFSMSALARDERFLEASL